MHAMRPSATDQEIQKWVWRQHGLDLDACWIAHCRELCGLADGTERREGQRCPPEKLPAIKQAFRHFGILAPLQ